LLFELLHLRKETILHPLEGFLVESEGFTFKCRVVLTSFLLSLTDIGLDLDLSRTKIGQKTIYCGETSRPDL
jgi:hypothetical protein